MTSEGYRRRRDDEAEEDARALVRIRDTLALVDPEDCPRSGRAKRAARQVEDIVTCIESELERYADYCHRCDGGDLDIRFSDRWSIRCWSCGWTAAGDTWEEALEAWNEEGSE